MPSENSAEAASRQPASPPAGKQSWRNPYERTPKPRPLKQKRPEISEFACSRPRDADGKFKARTHKKPKNPYAQRKPNARARLSNGTAGMILPGVDQRSVPARRFRDIAAAVVSDLGGYENCSETQLQLVRRFAALSLQAEVIEAQLADGKDVDIHAHVHLSGAITRVAHRLGLKRRKRDVTPTVGAMIIDAQESGDA